MSTIVRLRPATPADIPRLQAWDKEPHVIASSGDDDDLDWGEAFRQPPAHWENLIAERETPAGPEPVGFVQIIDPALEPTHYWGPDAPANHRAIDIWIGPAPLLGQGIGTAMMREAIARCFADPSVEGILIDPLARNTRAIAFYRRCGFTDVGPRRFGDDDCLVMRLSRPT